MHEYGIRCSVGVDTPAQGNSGSRSLAMFRICVMPPVSLALGIVTHESDFESIRAGHDSACPLTRKMRTQPIPAYPQLIQHVWLRSQARLITPISCPKTLRAGQRSLLDRGFSRLLRGCSGPQWQCRPHAARRHAALYNRPARFLSPNVLLSPTVHCRHAHCPSRDSCR